MTFVFGPFVFTLYRTRVQGTWSRMVPEQCRTQKLFFFLSIGTFTRVCPRCVTTCYNTKLYFNLYFYVVCNFYKLNAQTLFSETPGTNSNDVFSMNNFFSISHWMLHIAGSQKKHEILGLRYSIIVITPLFNTSTLTLISANVARVCLLARNTLLCTVFNILGD